MRKSDLCKAERRLSFQWVGLCKRCLRKFFAYAPVVAAPPSYAPKYTHGEGAGRKARGIVGSERASRRGDVAARRKMANRSGDAQWEYYLTVVAALLTVGGTPSAIVAQFSRAYRHRCARSQALPHAPPRCWRREGAPSIDASSSEAHTWSCRLKAARHWSAERKRYHANNGSAAPEPSRKQASAANRA